MRSARVRARARYADIDRSDLEDVFQLRFASHGSKRWDAYFRKKWFWNYAAAGEGE